MTIAGSDTSGGAGIQADIKTITSLGAHAMTAITALTAQNSLGITEIYKLPARFISKQIEAIMDDVVPHSVKVGMLMSGAAVREVSKLMKKYGIERLVVDPVMMASTGRPLLDLEAIPLLKRMLFPLARVVTPNLQEAEAITGIRVKGLHDMEKASKIIKELGPDVIITGGHLEGRCVDLFYDGKEIHHFTGAKIATKDTHGTGCVFSAALATFLAMEKDIKRATQCAHNFVRRAIKSAYPCGRGAGVVRPSG
ncbi:MAG: bifunctional hydroxymethylpyrimidine kinase/phosphomethylpyrimidine kinase [Pseudomonadota bacterium]